MVESSFNDWKERCSVQIVINDAFVVFALCSCRFA